MTVDALTAFLVGVVVGQMTITAVIWRAMCLRQNASGESR